MYVICNVVFDMNGCRQCQKYIVLGYYCSNGGSDFLCDAELYNGQFIRLNNPLDEFLVPILSKKDFESIRKVCKNDIFRRLSGLLFYTLKYFYAAPGKNGGDLRF